MEPLGPLFNLVLGFVVVMSGVSMLVSMLVGIVHRLADRRSRELAEMLALTNYAFRTHHGDYGMAGDEAAAAFVKDILSDAALISANDLAREPHKRASRPIEFIAKKDLVAIIRRRSEDGHLPRDWYLALPAHKATPDAFAHWLDQWFGTIEANATDRFRKESGRIVAVVSAIAVVFFNLDAIQLTFDLFHQGALGSALADHAPGLARLADAESVDPLGPAHEDPFGDFVQVNSLLNVPELKLGWQRSTFVERYCAWRGKCGLPLSLNDPSEALDDLDFGLYFARWLTGLLGSAMLLWLGAPFWADRLRDLLRLRSGVEQKAKRERAHGTPGLAPPFPPPS